MEYQDNEEHSEKIEEYKKVIMIIENTHELRLDEFTKEWFDHHRQPAPPAQERT